MTYGKSIFVLGLGFLMLLLASVLIAVPPRNTAQADVAGGSSVWVRYRLVNEISGTIEVDTTWTVDDSPYIVTGDLTVSEGVTLTIEPGVEVRFAITDALSSGEDQEKVELIVAGTLVADGVTFTSNADTPAAGDWYGIRFPDSSTDWDGNGGSIITNSIIEYGTVGISVTDASPMIFHNTIRALKGEKGVDCPGSDTFAGDGYGVYVSGSSSPTIQDNDVSGVSGGEGGSCSGSDAGGHSYGGSGYAIYVGGGSSPIIQGNLISSITGGRGGDCDEAYNDDTYAGDGYGIYIQAGLSPTIQDNRISGIDGGHGGQGVGCYGYGGNGYGIYISETLSPIVEGNNIADVSGGHGGDWHTVTTWGGRAHGGHGIGIYSKTSSPEIMNNAISNISGGSHSGNAIGIHLVDSSSSAISQNLVTRVVGAGGGIGGGGGATGDGGDGAGVYLDSSWSILGNNDISAIAGGASTSGDGGYGVGIWVGNDSTLTIEDNTISNIAGNNGGDAWRRGIVCQYGGAPGGNGGAGAGVYVTDGSSLNAVNNIISHIHAGDGGRGQDNPFCPSAGGVGGTATGVHVADSSATWVDNTVVATSGGRGGVPTEEATWAWRVSASSDDAGEFAKGDYDESGPYVLLGDDNEIQGHVGFRFIGVSISSGAIIDSAVLSLTAYGNSSASSANGTQFLIKGEAIGDSPTFSADNSPRDRIPTAAGVIWTVTESWIQGQTYSSPDLSAVIQEIVNREDRRSNSALTILVLDVALDNQNRKASTWDKSPDEAAELSITWHMPPGADGIGVGVNVNTSPTVTITNNIVVSHTIGISGTATAATLTYNDVWSTSEANYAGLPPGSNDVSVDPLFRDQVDDDYHLCRASPLIDNGMNEGAPATDFEGDPRPYDGDNDGVAVTDIGADEWVPGPAFLTVYPSILEFVGRVGRADPEPQSINVLNCGNSSALPWAAETDAPWLHTGSLTGVTTSTATVFADTGGLSIGKYMGTITVTGETTGVLNSPEAVGVTLTVLPLGDVDEDCDVDAEDIMAVANRWRARRDDSDYLEPADVNDDGLINVVDVQKTITWWGNVCPESISASTKTSGAVNEQSWRRQH